MIAPSRRGFLAAGLGLAANATMDAADTPGIPADLPRNLPPQSAGYEKAGCPEKFVGRFYDEPHIYSRAMQDEAFAWFEEKLKPST